MIVGEPPSLPASAKPRHPGAATVASTRAVCVPPGSPELAEGGAAIAECPCPSQRNALSVTFDEPRLGSATAIASRLLAPRRRRRLRPAPGRVVAPVHARLATGHTIVGREGNRSWQYLAGKRGLDLVGAAALLVLFSPIMAATYLILAVTTRGRPIFRQERLGLGGRPFTMYKFRTMHADAARRRHAVANEQDGPIFKNRRDPRITRLGRLLRSTSIDEMPQLVNVLLGQMSLVGPRPPLKAEVAQYQPWQRKRLSVKPGLTCLWQVSGRSEIGFEQWVRMDLWYVKNQGLIVDLGLLGRTPWSVLTRRGAY